MATRELKDATEQASTTEYGVAKLASNGGTTAGTVVQATDTRLDVAATTHAATAKTTPVDADEVPLIDSAASNVLKRATWANIKATLKTYFDTLYTAAGGYVPGGTDVAVADGGTGASTASAARTNLGLVIGTDVEAHDATLTALAGLNSTAGLVAETAADTFTKRSIAAATGLAVTNGDGASGNPTIAPDVNALTADASPDGAADYVMTYDASATAHKKVLLNNLPGGGGGGGYTPGGTDVAVADGGTGASTASAARTNLGLVIGTDVEAHDADLTTIAGLSPSNDDVLQRKAGAWANRTIAQLVTDLLATGSFPAAVAVQLSRTVVGVGGVASLSISLSLSGYDSIVVTGRIRAETTAADQDVWCQVNGDTSSNYTYAIMLHSDSQTPTRVNITGASTGVHLGGAPKGNRNAGSYASFTAEVVGAGLATMRKVFRCRSVWFDGTTNYSSIYSDGEWRSSSAITSLLIYLGSGDIAEGSLIEVFGIKS